MILSEPDVFTGIVDGSTLANDYVACLYCLPSEELDTKPFAF